MKLNDISTLQVKDYAAFLQPSIPEYRQGKYVQIVVLRETKSYAIFTTEGGPSLDVEVLQAGIADTSPVDRIVMYKRKQIAPERRTGKALMRGLGMSPSEDAKDKKGKVTVPKGECQIMGNACGICPDCILYGFAATTGTKSQRARILTDSGFVLRKQSQVMRDIKLNAIQETTAGGIAGSAFAHRENVLPQVFLPTVETLIDVTPHEFVYVLGNILRTTRYGAESNREGFIRNHILGIYFSDVEIFSNLELTQRFHDALAIPSEGDNKIKNVPDFLTAADFIAQWETIANVSLKSAMGRTRTMQATHLTSLLEDAGKLYGDENSLRVFLVELDNQSKKYAREVKGGAEPTEETETAEEE